MYGRQPAVHVEENVHLRSDGFSHGLDVAHRLLLDVLANIGTPRPRNGVELEGGEAACDDLLSLLRQSLRGLGTAGPAVSIDPDLVPTGTAQQGIDGYPKLLASNVPEGLFDTA